MSGDGRLVFPLYDEKDNLVTLQYIDSKGESSTTKGADIRQILDHRRPREDHLPGGGVCHCGVNS